MAGGNFGPGGSGGLNFAKIADTLGSLLDTTEAGLNKKIDDLGESPTQKELFGIQVGFQQWTMLVQMQATSVKEVGDALKGVIQKSG